jgi:hypothetical protein
MPIIKALKLEQLRIQVNGRPEQGAVQAFPAQGSD